MKKNIKLYLKDKIPEEKFHLIPTSFDIIGSKEGAIGIIEIPPEMEKYGEIIAEAIHYVHKNVKSVLAKDSERHSEFRLRDFKLLSGDPDVEIIHKESGCRFKFDPRLAYFSPRESTERERINLQVTSGEDILVLFSGIGPLPICITKKNPDVMVTAIELNPDAHRYCLENIRLNKVEDRVNAILGDVREIAPNLDKQYDRVLTPLPKGAYLFLDIIIPRVKPGGILHFYHWAPEDDRYSEAMNYIREACAKLNRQAEFLDGVRVAKYSPRFSKVRLDILIN